MSIVQARASGGLVVYPPEDTEWGTRRYRVVDLEGYEWSFGNYLKQHPSSQGNCPRKAPDVPAA